MRYGRAMVLAGLLLLSGVPAVEGLKVGVAQAQTVGQQKAEGDRLYKQGDELLNQGKFQAALEVLQKALEIYQELKNRSGEGQAYRGLGKASRELSQFDQAIVYHQKTLDIAREIGDRELELKAFNNFVLTYAALENSDKVLEFAQPALVLARELKMRVDEGFLLSFLAYAYANSNESKAIEAGQRALIISREVRNSDVEALALDALTRSYSSQNNPQKTLEFGQQSLTVSRQIKNQFFEGRALAFLANAYALMSQNQNAITAGKQALIITKITQDAAVEYIAFYALATAYKNLEEYDQSIEFAQRSLLIAQKNNNLEMEVHSLDFLGGLYGELEGRDREAESAIQKGLTIARRIPDYELEIQLLTTASSNAQLNDDYKKAIELAKQGFAIAQKHKIYGSNIGLIVQLSDLYRDLAAYREMADLAQQLLKFGKETGNSLLTSAGWMYLALAQFGQGQQPEALTSSQQFVAAAKAVENPLFDAAGMFLLSFGYGNAGNYEQALTLSQQGLSITRELDDSDMESAYLELQGNIYYKTGQFKQAIEAYRAALGIDEESSSAKSGLARVYRDIDMPITAIAYYKQAINKVEKERKSLRNLSSDLQDSVLQTIEGLGNVRSVDAYRELADLLLSQGRIGEAQQVLELLKVQELRDYTRDTRAGATPESLALDKSEAEIVKAHTTLVAFAQGIKQCYDDSACKSSDRLPKLIEQRNQQNIAFTNLVKTLEVQLKNRVETDVAFINPNDPNNDFRRRAEEILNSQPGTLLIYPLVLEDKMWLLVGSEGPVFTRYEVDVGQKELAETVLQFRTEMKRCEASICTQADTARVKQISQKLYQWIFPEKLRKELQANVKQPIQNLVFAPDRSTRYIPMGALFDGEKYLIERYTVSTIVAASKTDSGAKLPVQPRLLAMGLSDAVPGFSALSGVPVELDAIVKTAQPQDTQGVFPGNEFLNQTFTKSKLQIGLPQHQILHLATHGKFVPSAIEQSFLVLGDGSPFKIPDIQELDGLPDIHLVVLSACETALGDRREQDGIEIAGISNAFLQRGVKSVVASLWQVNDPSTSLWMQRFYQNLSNGTMTKSQAMRQVQQDFLSGKVTLKELQNFRASGGRHVEGGGQIDLTHPYYWAPFILIGNGL